jgi:hypothetical protein
MPDNAGPSSSEVFRYGGYGSVLLIALLVYVGLHPLALGGTAARVTGAAIVAVILVSGTMAASRSHLLRLIGLVFGIVTFGSQILWLTTGDRQIEALMMGTFSIFCFYTGGVILRHVLSFGPLYADRVHAALSVYILLAFAWAGAYAMLEILSPGAFSIPHVAGAAPDEGGPLLADMMHLSIATLTSTGFGDITPVAPFARSLSQLEQLTGVFYIAVLISRLIGLYPMEERAKEEPEGPAG